MHVATKRLADGSCKSQPETRSPRGDVRAQERARRDVPQKSEENAHQLAQDSLRKNLQCREQLAQQCTGSLAHHVRLVCSVPTGRHLHQRNPGIGGSSSKAVVYFGSETRRRTRRWPTSVLKRAARGKGRVPHRTRQIVEAALARAAIASRPRA